MDLDFGMNLYEINKQLMEKEKPLDPIMLNRKLKEVTLDITARKYTMLLCRERHDFTIFYHEDSLLTGIENPIKEVRETLQNRGEIISIDKQESGAYEIWMRDFETKEIVMYMLFDYSWGIVNV